MTLPSILASCSSNYATSFAFPSQNKRYPNLASRNHALRNGLLKPMTGFHLSRPNTQWQPSRIEAKNDSPKSDPLLRRGVSVAGSVAFLSLTLSGVMNSASAKDSIQLIKALASGNGGDGSVPNGGGGGGGGNSGQELFQIAVTTEEDDEDGEENEAEDEDVMDDDEIEEFYEDDLDEEDYVDPAAPFECNNVKAIGLPVSPGVPRDVDLFAGLNCQKGFRCTQEELRNDLRTLSQ